MTYDRAVTKIDEHPAAAAATKLYRRHRASARSCPRRSALRSIGSIRPCTRERTGAAGVRRSFLGKGRADLGRGDAGNDSRHRVECAEIWLRRRFTPGDVDREISGCIYHDEDAEVYINGVLAARLPGYTTDYQLVPVAGQPRRIAQRREHPRGPLQADQRRAVHRRGPGRDHRAAVATSRKGRRGVPPALRPPRPGTPVNALLVWIAAVDGIAAALVLRARWQEESTGRFPGCSLS